MHIGDEADIVRDGDLAAWQRDLAETGSVSFTTNRRRVIPLAMFAAVAVVVGGGLLYAYVGRGAEQAALWVGIGAWVFAAVLVWGVIHLLKTPEVVTITPDQITSSWGVAMPLRDVRGARVGWSGGSSTLVLRLSPEGMDALAAGERRQRVSVVQQWYTRDDEIGLGTNLTPNADVIARLINVLIADARDASDFASDARMDAVSPEERAAFDEIEDGGIEYEAARSPGSRLVGGTLIAAGLLTLGTLAWTFVGAAGVIEWWMVIAMSPPLVCLLAGVVLLVRGLRERPAHVRLTRAGVSGPYFAAIPWDGVTGARWESSRNGQGIVLHVTEEALKHVDITSRKARQIPNGSRRWAGSIGPQLRLCDAVRGAEPREVADLIALFAQTRETQTTDR